MYIIEQGKPRLGLIYWRRC